jgi:hypothetical protein
MPPADCIDVQPDKPPPAVDQGPYVRPFAFRAARVDPLTPGHYGEYDVAASAPLLEADAQPAAPDPRIGPTQCVRKAVLRLGDRKGAVQPKGRQRGENFGAK